MKTEEKFLITCLRSFLSRTSCEFHAQEFDWTYFYQLAKIHYVGGMVYLALKDSSHVPPEALDRFKYLFHFSVNHSIRREIQLQDAEEALCSAKIPHIYFKGQELCRYYPVPEVRLMSDVDLLIRKQDSSRMEKALKEAGFIQKSKNITGYAFEKNQFLLEVHTEFAKGPQTGADLSSWLSNGFQNGEFAQNSYTGYFPPTFHFLYLIYHAAKHFNSTGAGVRMFLDLAVFWNHYKEKIDLKEIHTELRKMKLDIFADTAFWLCNHWFDCKIPMGKEPSKNLKAFMEDYIFSGGVYGHEKRSFSDLYVRKAVTDNNIEKKFRQKLAVYMQLFFPDRNRMELFLPAVRSHPVLLPVAWIIRWYRALFKQRKKSWNSLNRVRKGNAEAEKEYKMLKLLGLIK